MRIKNTKENWGAVAKTLHWVLAILILGMIPFGWWMEGLPNGQAKIDYYQWHKSTGVVILLFVITRFAWRMSSTTPPLPDDMAGWEKIAAKAGHGALYAAIFAQPVIGILMSQASSFRDRFPVKLFGWPLPNVVPVNETLENVMSSLHSAVAWTILALVAIHVIAALKHHFLDKNRVLVRMLPGR